MQKDDANAMWGELREGLHGAGYLFERACSRVKTLLKNGDWKVGGRFKDVYGFLESLRFESLEVAMEEKKEIARLIKQLEPKASNRQIAKAVGVGRSTVKRATGPSGPAKEKKANQNKADSGPRGSGYSGERAAKLVERRETAKQDRLDKVAADEQRVLQLRPVPGTHRTLIFDPAWEYDWLSIAGRAKPGYAMQTLDQLRELDVKQWADPAGCHLYCWVTNNFMAEACKLVAHWGFQHRLVLTWIKPPPFGLGSYFRNSTEHVLFATLGDTTTRHAAASMPTHFEAPRGEHSEKPDKFYEIVRAASYPSIGEGNMRKTREGITNLFCPVTDAPETYQPVEAAE